MPAVATCPLATKRPVSPAILPFLEERMKAMPLTVATCPLATKLGLKPMVFNKSHMK